MTTPEPGKPLPNPDYPPSHYLNKSPRQVSRAFPLGKILHNRAKCGACGEVVTSSYEKVYQTCACGDLSVDCGQDYLRRAFRTPFVEMSEVEGCES